MGLDNRLHNVQVGRNCVKGADFVLAHQSAIPLNASTKVGGELALEAAFSHGGLYPRKLNISVRNNYKL